MPPTAKLASSSTSAASAAAAAGSGSKAASVGRGEGGRFEQRLGQAGPTRLLEHPDQVDVAEAETAGRFGHDEGRRAELGQHGPAVLGQLGSAPTSSASSNARSASTLHSVSSTVRTP